MKMNEMNENEERMSVMLLGVGKWRMASRYFFAWAHTVTGDLKSCKLNCVCCKDKLVWVKCYAVSPTNVKPVNRLVEAAADIVCPQQGAINTFGLV